MHRTRVAKFSQNLHAVTLLHRGINSNIGKHHNVSGFFPIQVDVTFPKLTEHHHNAIGPLRAGSNQGDGARHIEFAEPLVTGFACITTTQEGRKEMFYLTTHSTHFIYGYTASDIWLRTILIVRWKTRCRHIGYSYRLTARVLLYAPSHRQDNTYHGLWYTSCGALAGTRNSSMGPPHEGSIRRPIAP